MRTHEHQPDSDRQSWQVGVVVLAAGSGERLGRGPKALVEVGGQPLLIHAVRAAADNDRVSEIVVTAPDHLLDQFASLVQAASPRKPVQVVAGGPTRQASGSAGVSALTGDLGWAAVTDAARPFARPGLIDDLITAVRKATGDSPRHGRLCGAFPMLAIADSLHRLDSHAMAIGGVDRSVVRAAQTPQLVNRACLTQVYQAAAAAGLVHTDEVGLVSHFGGRMLGISGDPLNLKVTFPQDLELAEAIHDLRPIQNTSRE